MRVFRTSRLNSEAPRNISYERGFLRAGLFAPRPTSKLEDLCTLSSIKRSPPLPATILIVIQLLKKFSAFYGTPSSLPCSQEPASGPYTDPDESTLFP
jgi:hypothetical protein